MCQNGLWVIYLGPIKNELMFSLNLEYNFQFSQILAKHLKFSKSMIKI